MHMCHVQASLKRMQMDYVDLLYCHRPDPNTPIEETVRAMNWIIDQGWAFYWGTSEWSAEQILEVSVGSCKECAVLTCSLWVITAVCMM